MILSCTVRFTSDSFPKAVRSLFEENSYDVVGPKQVHGAEVDLIASSKTDPFAKRIYIEATIEYVNNDKYGKDLSKLAMLREQDPSALSSLNFRVGIAPRASFYLIELPEQPQFLALKGH